VRARAGLLARIKHVCKNAAKINSARPLLAVHADGEMNFTPDTHTRARTHTHSHARSVYLFSANPSEFRHRSQYFSVARERGVAAAAAVRIDHTLRAHISTSAAALAVCEY